MQYEANSTSSVQRAMYAGKLSQKYIVFLYLLTGWFLSRLIELFPPMLAGNFIMYYIIMK